MGLDLRRINHWSIVVGALAVTLATALHAWQLRATQMNEDGEELRVSARVMALSVNRGLMLAQELLEGLDAEVHHLSQGKLAAVEPILKRELHDEPLIRDLVIVGPDARVLASSDPRHRGLDVGYLGLEGTSGANFAGTHLSGPHDGLSLLRILEAGTHQRHLVVWRRMVDAPGLIALAVVDSESMGRELTDLHTVHTGGYSIFNREGKEWVDSADGAATTASKAPATKIQHPPATLGLTADAASRDAAWLTHEANTRDFPLQIQVRTSISEINARWLQAMRGPLLMLALMLGGLLFYHRRAVVQGTREQQSQALLASSEQQLASIVEHAAEGIVTLGLDGVVRRYNRAAALILGVPAHIAIGRQAGDLFMAEDTAANRHLFYQYVEGFDRMPDTARGSLPIRRSDGQALELDYAVSRHAEGADRLLTVIFRDMSAERAAELRFSTLFQQSAEAQVIMSWPDPRILDCNEAAVTLFGAARREDMLGLSRDEFILPETVEGRLDPASLQAELAALEHGKTIRVKGRLLTLNQRNIPVEISATQVLLGQNRVRLITLRDLSAAEQAEQALRTSHAAAEAAARAKARFLAVMSHELRTPMSGIIGMIDMLGETGLDVEQRRFLSVLRGSSAALLQVLNDILDYSKLETGRVDLEHIDFDLDALISRVISVHRASALQSNTVLKVDWGGAPMRALRGDPARLAQVLHNLIGNAVKFTPSGSVTVRLDTEADDAGPVTLAVQVADTGVGMSAEVLEALFRPFSQGDASMSRRFGGTGLGLAICRQLVEAMGGTIAVDSAPGRGSVFRFSVQMARAAGRPDPKGDPLEPTPVPRSRRSLQVLAAEDNPTNRMLLELRMKKMGHRLHVVENGEQAVQAARLARYDAILMDIHMPVMDGATATRAIRALPGPAGDLPIIGLSADALPEMREAHMRSGLTAYLTKPVDWADLARLIEAVVPAERGEPIASAADEADAIEPGASDDGAATPRLDSAHIDGVRNELGPDNWALIVQVFWPRAEADLHACEAAVLTHDAAARKNAAHSIKGAANTVGFRSLAGAASRLEHCAREDAAHALRTLQGQFEATAADWRAPAEATA